MHTKRINRLGRIVIPKEILEIIQLKEGDSIDILHNERSNPDWGSLDQQRRHD